MSTRAAKSNRHYHDMIRKGCSTTVVVLDAAGFVGGPSRLLPRRAQIV